MRSARPYIRRLRYAFQWALFALILYGGYRLYLFEGHFTRGTELVQRPSLVDGFLPIGSLMSLKLWLVEGVLDPVHPAGIVIFGTALFMSLVLKKSFCGWVCPVGAISEQIFKLGARIFGRNFVIPRYLDYPLRSIKYLLMGLFLHIVFIKMDGPAIAAFLGTSYWKVADIKMLHFFTDMSGLTMAVLAALVGLSLLYRNFWCRYLCPYGALVGLLSMASPLKITRTEDKCIHCSRCTRHCPALLPVEEKTRLASPECTGCLTCVSVCPAPGALDIAPPGRRAMQPVIYMVLVAALFFGIIGAAQLSNRWASNVTYEEYRTLIPRTAQLEHP